MFNRRKYKKGELVTIAKEIPDCTIGWDNNIKVGNQYPVVTSSDPAASASCSFDIIRIKVNGGSWWIPYECIALGEQLLFDFMYEGEENESI